MMKMHKLMKDADELHFKYSRKELSAELKKEKRALSQITVFHTLIPK